ncbi:hypothetical protein [Sporocytophaga myxococcoides]|uniref:hypothetical protein n=1 Tax=Sporocytophaga myxococcoides TaxID=153721 RepID=UPI00041238EF|nr:hypothetical protein [Sporocytophaga myxococcoides]
MSDFLPSLSTLFPVENMPENFGVFKDGIGSVFSDLYYKNLQIERSVDCDSAFYSLKIKTYKKLALEIPGTGGLGLLLNPNFDGTSTEIPISLDYTWPILKYSKSFELATFDWSPKSIFDILLEISGVTVEDLLTESINSLIDNPDPIQKFVDDFNAKYRPVNPLSKSTNQDDTLVILNLIDQITDLYVNNTISVDIYTVIFDMFLGIPAELGDVTGRIETLFSKFMGNFTQENIKELFIPKVSLFLDNIDLALEFPRSIFTPLDDDKNSPTYGKPLPDSARTLLTFNVGSFSYSTDKGLEFKGENNLSFQKSLIGNTGLTIDFEGAKLDLSRTLNIPEAAADGRPDNFVGVFIEKATIGLPAFWTKSSTDKVEIYGRNLIVGTGGFSGTIGMEAIDPKDPNPVLLETKFGGESGFSLALDTFEMTFKQNVITGSNIHGRMTIPKFSKDGNDKEPAVLDVSVSFGNGEFMISAAIPEPLKITLPGLLDVYINSGKIGKEDDRFYFEITGGLKFQDMGGAIGEFLPEKIDIQRFRIWSDGQVEIAAGGTTKLKSPKTLTIGPVKLTITAIHYGTHEQMHDNQMRKYWYFGFDGGVSINPGGVDARGDGIKFYFTVDNNKSQGREPHFFLRIQSIAIDLIIPGGSSPEQAALLLSGYLSMKDPAEGSKYTGTEYIGGVTFSLPKVGLSGSAAMRLNPDVPAFLIDVGLELPAPIPLGPTGLGIYGFRGLVGKHYVATKNAAGVPESGSWYEYYKKKQAPDFKEGIQVSKFELEDGFSIGAGVSFATATDSGRTFSSKVFLLLSIPELFAIQGQAALLKERIGIDSTTDPPFSLFLAITKESVTSEFGVNLRIPESGAVFDGKGLIEMGFFFKDAGAWYMNFGRETPNDKRLQARVLSLFNMYSYLMISGSGIKAGGGVSFGFDKGIGPLRVKLSAYMDMAGRLSFRPAQLGGSIALGGEAAIQVFFIKLGLKVFAFLAAEAPKPLMVTGAVGISVPKPSIFRKKKGGGKTINETIDFTWTLDRELNMDEIQILEPGKAKALNIMSGETFDLLYSPNGLPATPPDVLIENHVIPVDSFVEIEFLRGMGFDPSSPTVSNFYRPPYGASYTELYPPQKGKSKQVEHSYLLSQLNIKIWNPTSRSWEDYEPYQAMAPALTNTVVNFSGNIADLKYGSWQAYQPNNYNRLRLLCQNPLSYMEANPLPTETLGFRDNFMSCLEPRRFKSVNFENSPVSIFRNSNEFNFYKNTILVRMLDGDGRVTSESNTFGFTNGLVLPNGSEVELLFEQPAAKIDLKLKTLISQVEVKYLKKVKVPDHFVKLIPGSQWQEAAPSAIVDAEDLTAAISFEANSDLSNCVDKIVIKGLGTCTEVAWLLVEDGFDLLKEDLGNLLLEDGNSCTTSVFEMRWEDKTDYQFNKTLPANQAAVDADNDLLKQALETTVQPVWRPDSIFGIELVTKDHLVGNETKDYDHQHTFMFRTAGPVGHFHDFSKEYKRLEKEDKTQQYKLRSLGHYIDYSKCYPNADGKLTDAKPLFYEDPELNLFYKYNFVYTMFQDFGTYKGNTPVTSKLQALILDPSNSSGQQQATDSEWKETSKTGSEEDKVAPIIRGDVKALQNLLNPENPGNCSSTPLENPLNIKSTFVTDTLLPDKLYTALFQSAFNGSINGREKTAEVHSYVFRTSRYKDFADQINSFFVKYKESENSTEELVTKSLFSIEKEFESADLSKVSSLISAPETFDQLKGLYANGYDRIVTGFLKLPAIAPADSMEINIIKNITAENERIVGVIVRSPEPFNDPKIPESELLGSIKMKYSATQGGTITRTNQASEIFLSKDRSSAFITFNDNGPVIQPGYLYFDFKYLTWNGKAYVQKSSVTNFEVQVQ